MLCAVVKSNLGPLVHRCHISVQLHVSFKTFQFGCTMLTICNDIVSNAEMSHCKRNVAYMRFAHNIDFNIKFSHNCAINVKAQIYTLEQQHDKA